MYICFLNKTNMRNSLLFIFITISSLFSTKALSQAGFTCDQAISITSLPYQTTDNTVNYSDTFDIPQPSGCVVEGGNYMDGNDVFYSYIPTSDAVINIKMTPTDSWSGIFVYDGCSNVGITCIGGVANSSDTIREINELSVLAGHTYIIVISTFPQPQTIGYTLEIQNTINCLVPTLLTCSGITSNSITLNWGAQSGQSNYEVIALPCNAPAPAASASGNICSSTSFTFNNLTPSTCYSFYVRSLCNNNEYSTWSTITNINTTVMIPVCGGQFIDNGGSNGLYANNSDDVYTIYPSNPGDVVSVNFTTFDLEQNYDGLYVYNGSSTSATLISSGNLAGAIPGGVPGAFWGTTIPGPFTSTDPCGCLTFRFRSDNTINHAGWTATVECQTPTSCVIPSAATINSISGSGATVSWIENGTASHWQILVLPATSPAPLQTDTGVTINTNPYQINGLLYATAYKVYIKSICQNNTNSYWSNPTTFTTISNNCLAPTAILTNSISATEANLSWTQTGTVNQWEVIVLPLNSPAPTATAIGTITTTNSYQATGLTSGSVYTIYVRAICSTTESSNWSIGYNFTPFVSSPAIVTNTTQYTNSQLVNDVLINNPCLTVSNISSSTGTNFGSVNGIGYFTNSNPAFPISSGIILSTGNALNAHGPNSSILNEGGTAWTGDSQLEGIISSAIGQPMNSFNATKLEFDFTSLNSYMSFNFLFASDEYGTFQCDYADAFAFLLTDLETGITTNLAVVPGTTIPVSVVTIRNMENNSSCASSNPAFFGSYTAPNTSVSYGSPTNFNGQTMKMTASANIIPNHNYHIKLVIADRGDSIYDSAVFIEAGTFASGPPECSDKIQLVAFIDDNGNGIKDTNEVNFTYGSFTTIQNNSSDVTNISSPLGIYTLYDTNPLNIYDFGYQINPEFIPYYSVGVTNYNDINIPVNSGTQILYFPITLTQGFNDVEVNIAPIGTPRPGYYYVNKIAYRNLGVANASGTITFTKDTNVSIAYVSESGNTITSTGFTYDFTNLNPYETRYIYVAMLVDSNAVIGDLLTNSVSISATSNDVNLTNNSNYSSQIVVASYDPNDKMESHGEKIKINEFNQNDYLFYTLRFQNIGTANAINIKIEDILDSRIDEESIRAVTASHNYIMERINNNITFKFDYIQLPSYLENEELSKGYITFKVKLKPGFAVGDIIPNTASIYFDNNAPVITNTFNTEFVASLANEDFNSSNFMLYPNPSNSIVQVSLQHTTDTIQNITIYDVLGKTIKTINKFISNDISVDVSNFSKGVYFFEITTNTNLKSIKKLVVN